MLSLDELHKQVDAYRRGATGIDEFEDWFRTESRGAYESPQDALVAAVESALSKYHFQRITELQLRMELENAIQPFVTARLESFSR